MKTLLLLAMAGLMVGCDGQHSAEKRREINQALDSLQASYRRDCVVHAPETAMIEACAKVRETLGRYGR